jgi:hypothetical protein
MAHYLGSAARILLICLTLGLLLLALKWVSYSGYIVRGEWRKELAIWLVVSLAVSFLSPLIGWVRFRGRLSK